MRSRLGISSLTPYSYFRHQSTTRYQFTTKTGALYSLDTIDPSSSYGIPNHIGCRLIFFVLTLERGNDLRFDPRIKDTVVHFVLRQLEKNKDVIFYVCSARGHLEHARQRLFTRWYNQRRPKDIVQETRTVDGDQVYFIFNTKNRFALQILESIDVYNLNSKA